MPAFASCPSGWRRGTRLAPVLAGALIVTAAWLTGAEEPAPSPLEDVKVDLKAIQRGNSSEFPAAPAGPRVAVPGFSPAQGEAAPTAAPSASWPNSQAGRKPANSNWLLEAMELQARTRPNQGAGAKAPGENKTIAVDSSDPAYLLKLYLAQEPPGEGQSETSSPGKESRAVKDMDVGALDGFLKQWIAPRDLALLGLDATAQAATADLLSPGTRASAVAFGQTSMPPGAPNPFLEALKFDPLPLDLTPAAPRPANLPPPAPAVSSAPPKDSNQPAERNPPPNLAEDKKYFPQLKRF
jgi:hypothetical protein